MDVIQLAKNLGKALQEDERFIKVQIAKQQFENDVNTQRLMQEYKLRVEEINKEAEKGNSEPGKIDRLSKEIKELYNSINSSDSSMNLSREKFVLDSLLRQIYNIIFQAAEGKNPDTIELESSGCSGSCGSCSGCH